MKRNEGNNEMDDKLIKLEVFRVWQDQTKIYAEIKVKHNEIVWLNTNVPTTKVQKVGFFPGKHLEPFLIENISQNFIDNVNGRISHRIYLKRPNDRELYVMIGKKEQIELGIIEKPKKFLKRLIDFSVNGIWIWLERIGFVLAIPVSLLVLRQCSNDNKIDKSYTPTETHSNQINSKINSTDTLSILKTDS